MDLGPLGFAVAIKFGVSEKLHVDVGDSSHSHVILGSAGPYEGANLRVPQANASTALPSGGMMAFMAGVLAHGNETVLPQAQARLIFTVFSCKGTVKFLEALLEAEGLL